MLFRIPPLGKDTVKKANPEISAVPEFAELTDKQLRVMALVFDYKSPFRQKPQADRWRLAFLAAGYTPMEGHNNTFDMRAREIMDGKHPKMNAAIKKFLDLQFDEDIENLKAIQTQIDNIRAMTQKSWTDPDDLKKVNGLLLTLPELREAQKIIARNSKLDYSFGEQEEDDTQKNMSTIDKVVMDESQEV